MQAIWRLLTMSLTATAIHLRKKTSATLLQCSKFSLTSSRTRSSTWQQNRMLTDQLTPRPPLSSQTSSAPTPCLILLTSTGAAWMKRQKTNSVSTIFPPMRSTEASGRTDFSPKRPRTSQTHPTRQARHLQTTWCAHGTIPMDFRSSPPTARTTTDHTSFLKNSFL